MKVRLSATVEKETEKVIEALVAQGEYRNKSHVIERAVQFLKEEKHNDSKK